MAVISKILLGLTILIAIVLNIVAIIKFGAFTELPSTRLKVVGSFNSIALIFLALALIFLLVWLEKDTPLFAGLVTGCVAAAGVMFIIALAVYNVAPEYLSLIFSSFWATVACFICLLALLLIDHD